MQRYMRGYYRTNWARNKGGNGVRVGLHLFESCAQQVRRRWWCGVGARGMLIDQPAPVARPDTPHPPLTCPLDVLDVCNQSDMRGIRVEIDCSSSYFETYI